MLHGECGVQNDAKTLNTEQSGWQLEISKEDGGKLGSRAIDRSFKLVRVQHEFVFNRFILDVKIAMTDGKEKAINSVTGELTYLVCEVRSWWSWHFMTGTVCREQYPGWKLGQCHRGPGKVWSLSWRKLWRWERPLSGIPKTVQSPLTRMSKLRRSDREKLS